MVELKDVTKIIKDQSVKENSDKTWKYLVIGGIGVVVVLALLLIGFFLNTILTIAIILVSLCVVGVIGVLIYQATRKNKI